MKYISFMVTDWEGPTWWCFSSVELCLSVAYTSSRLCCSIGFYQNEADATEWQAFGGFLAGRWLRSQGTHHATADMFKYIRYAIPFINHRPLGTLRRVDVYTRGWARRSWAEWRLYKYVLHLIHTTTSYATLTQLLSSLSIGSTEDNYNCSVYYIIGT